jgi:hypothetical protein
MPNKAGGKLAVMNRMEIRSEVGRWAEKAKAKSESGHPTDIDVATLKELWAFRKSPSILSPQLLRSSVDVFYSADPDWKVWSSIAERFGAYHAALTEIDNKSSGPLAQMRLSGV